MKVIDNINNLLGDDLKASLLPGSKLKIAASCFSIYAYEALKAELSKIKSMEFMFTAPTFIPDEVTDKIRREHKEFYIPKAERERSLSGSEFEIKLKNELTQRAIARECSEWIRRKASFRSNKTSAAMQQFALIQQNEKEVAYTLPSGFTAVELGYQNSNAASNLVNKMDGSDETDTYRQTFDQIWNDSERLKDVTTAICDHIASIYQENSPEHIYFLMLHNIFNEFIHDISEDVMPNERTGYRDTLIWKKLFNYQKDAAVGIINKLETYNGCILADSVGLGKTFTALAVIKYYELRNRSVLVLCPKKIADNWQDYNRNLKTNIFEKDRFNYEILCHTDLSRNSGTSFGTDLSKINWGNYDLVVIDESHNFRNNDAYKDRETRYQKLMDKVIRGGVKTKVLMLSATPVNNRFSDLRNQLALAYEGNSENLSKNLRGTISVEQIFLRAQSTFNQWSKLPVEQRTAKRIMDSLDFDFFELLDSVTIARSRKHIQKFYDTKDIGEFPERRKPISFRIPLTERDDVPSIEEIFIQLSSLKLSIYAPINYILPSRLRKYEERYDTLLEGGGGRLKQADRERSLQALMTTNLLKRLESSVEAFRLTLSNLHEKYTLMLDRIEEFKRSGDGSVTDETQLLEALEAEDDELPIISGNNEIGGKVKIDLADMDLPSWENHLSADLETIHSLLSSMQKITPEDDAKLQHLRKQILSKIENPINENNKKVLLFTAFTDTADYLYKNLAELLKTKGLHTGKVTGSGRPTSTLEKKYDFQSLLTLFSPISKGKALILQNEPSDIDLLIGTDCIAEGQNLQDCDYLVNYDIHWNPVRIIQRFGRIDRIGSQNKVIQLTNYWPDITLDDYINLKERVETRMVIADVTATGDENLLTNQGNEVSYRKEQLLRLQDEIVEIEDLKTGISITDLGLNDFRMDLFNYIKKHGDLEHAPRGMHAVVPVWPELNLQPGVIFALRNLNDGVNVHQHNRLHPYYLVYIAHNGDVIINHTEVKKLLDLVRTNCRGKNKPITKVCNLFNKQTNEGRNMQTYSRLLVKSIDSIRDVAEEKDIDSLFAGTKTTALRHTIPGLDEFELIAFLVIHPERG